MGGMPTPPPTSKARGRSRCEREAPADRPEQADDIAFLARGQRMQAGADHLVEHLDPAGIGIHAHERQRPSHRDGRIAGDVGEASRLGMRGALRRVQANHVLIAGEVRLAQYPGIFEKDRSAVLLAHALRAFEFTTAASTAMRTATPLRT